MSLNPRERDVGKIAARVSHLDRNRIGEITLNANATSTTVSDLTITPASVIRLDAMTANAAAAIPTTFVALLDRLRGSFVITHANNAQTDRTFRWIAGGD